MEYSKIEVDLKSENFVAGDSPIRFHMTVKFCQDAGEVEISEGEAKTFDPLMISIHSKKPVPDEVKEYITNNLGAFEFVEEENEKKFLFELKIKDINFAEINKAYREHFKKSADGIILEIDYARSENFDACYERMKSFYRSPLMMHFLEKSQFKMTLQHNQKLLHSFFAYLLASKIPLLNNPVVAAKIVSQASAKAEFGAFDSFPHKLFEKFEYDQRENFKEFLSPFDNAINSFIFNDEEPGNLTISGRVLNILDYKIEANLPKFASFIQKVEKL